jgi:hypothetical protein
VVLARVVSFSIEQSADEIKIKNIRILLNANNSLKVNSFTLLLLVLLKYFVDATYEDFTTETTEFIRFFEEIIIVDAVPGLKK